MPDVAVATKAAKRRFQLRPWVRALHRDAGYFAVGLTIVYALSGLAVNHIADWDPSFQQLSRTHQVNTPLPAEPEVASRRVLAELGIREVPREVYAPAEGSLEIVFDRRTLHVATSTGRVLEEGQSPRLFLRAANWLHLNRGKRAWTYVADMYAVLLLYLAISGLFMIPGRKGLLGRGALIAALGAAVPVGYVVFSGGPEAKNGARVPEALE
jgi:hypothetical protein